MSSPSPSLHVYQRDLATQGPNSLTAIAQRILPGARVLDLGCGDGALGAWLLAQQPCTVDGVTINQAEADLALAQGYRRTQVADLDLDDLAPLGQHGPYDAVVCADVLEHLKHPERVLAAARSWLAPGGQLLLSIPNAGYAGLVAELMAGEWRYRPEGLLDETHLRFYTRQSLQRFLDSEGWHLGPLEGLPRALHESEFHVAFDRLPPAVSRHLLSLPDALTYQLIGSATPQAPTEAIPPVQPVPTTPAPAEAHFTVQLYLGAEGRFDEQHKIVRSAAIGLLRQTITFDWSTPQALTGLRLDPADRPGFLHLFRISLKDGTGQVAWDWQAGPAARNRLDTAHSQQMAWGHPLLGDADGALVLLTGDDPWLHLPVPATVWHTQPEGRWTLEVELGWPMSADYLALIARLQALQLELAQARQAAQSAREPLQGQLQLLETSLANANANTQHLFRQLKHQELALQHHRADEVQGLRERADQLQAHLHNIESSRAFRLARRLGDLKQRLSRSARAAAPAAPQARPSEQVRPSPPPTEPVRSRLPSYPDQPIDVIVPVYRGLDDTRLCIESVLASQSLAPYRLIVINDASPEPQLTQWLRDKAATDTRVILLENSSNLGFVGTVNRGMALDNTHDVLLLNSDTEVAFNWLDHLKRAAYSDPRIGTVTPFSNNATICSYPRFCADNELPEGYSTGTLHELCARTNPGEVVDVPTGVGFCMYIRRDCLSEVGLFDVEHFGKGYGEENDFCQRAQKVGWRNVHALDTFVRHSGGVSFGDSKSPRELAAMRILERLHPDYDRQVQAFVQQDPARRARQKLDYARLQASSRPRMLLVLHARGGGTHRHAQELATHFATQALPLALMPEAEGTGLRLSWFEPGEAWNLLFRWPDEQADLVALLRDLGVRHVHFHHLLGHDAAVRQLPSLLGVGYDFTAHDYHTICPQVSLTTPEQHYCGEPSDTQCNGCLVRRPQPNAASIQGWRAEHGQFLSGARHVLAPSLDTARRLLRYQPLTNLHLAPHLDLAAPAALPAPQPMPLPAHAHLRVLVLGALSQIKGSDTLEAVTRAAAQQDAPLDFHLVGYPNRPLATQPHASLTIHGRYEEQDLPRLLKRLQPDLIWFPAQWPETYNYTLSTCLQAGLPVVAPRLGAFPERLAQRDWTWLQPWNLTASQWLAFFEQIRQDHFVSGLAPGPTPPLAQAPEDVHIAPWSYDAQYLADWPQPATDERARPFDQFPQAGRTRLDVAA